MRPPLTRLVRLGAALLLAGAAVVLVALVAVLVAAQLPAVQGAAWSRAVRAIDESTGWRVAARAVEARLLWSPRLEIHDLTVGTADRTVATVQRVSVAFHWRSLLASPPRIDSVELEGVTADLRGVELPSRPAPPDDRAAADPWRTVEIGSVSLRGVSAEAAIPGFELELDGAVVSGLLEDGGAEVAATIDSLGMTRGGRRLEVGPVDVAASASDRGVAVERLSVEGRAVSGTVALTADLGERRADGSGRVEVDLRAMVAWWDPDLAVLLDPKGRLQLEGGGSGSLDGGFEMTVDHVGAPIELAGYPVERFHAESEAGEVRLEAASGGWGGVTLRVTGGDATLHARLEGAAVGPAVARFAGSLPAWIPGPVFLAGTVDASTPLPLDVDRAAARVDLRVTAPRARAEIRGEGIGRSWRADRLVVELPGARLEGSGSVERGDSIRGNLSLEVENPATLTAHLGQWMHGLEGLAVAGGPAGLEAEVGGTVGQPSANASLVWQQPSIAGFNLDSVEASARGKVDELVWSLRVEPAEGSAVEATGFADVRRPSSSGSWKIAVADLQPVLAIARPAFADRLAGELAGSGTFSWDSGRWAVGGALQAARVRMDDWIVDDAQLELDASPEAVELRRLELRLLGGTVTGSGRAELADARGQLEVDLQWSDLDPSLVPMELPADAVAGRIAGGLRVAGSLREPVGELGLSWIGSGGSVLVRSGSLRAALSDGEVRLTSDGLETAAGPLAVTGSVPLGDLPRPEGLWPDAPHGPVELSVTGAALDLGALATALGRGPLPVEIVSNLALRLRWSLSDPMDRVARLLLEDFAVRHAGGEITAPDGIGVRLDGGVVVLEQTRLVGPRAVLHLAGEVDPRTLDIRLEVDGQLAPEIAQVIPYPVRISEPLTLRVSAKGPLTAPGGTLILDHRGGTVVLRDPPVELTDLHVVASLSGGALWIEDGSAGVNRGKVQIGGGWDPASGQGLVAELDDVTFFAAGTLTRWSGLLAIEPDPEATARVVGDLVLAGGVWEQPADIAGAFLAGAELEPAADDPLAGIALDLTVRARTGIRVDNNLGRFDVRWDRLRVGGTAARPLLRGDVRIAPGGVVNLPGKRVELQRGTIRFTGDPSVDPVLELVPTEDVATYGGATAAEGSGIDTYALAAQTLYGGVGRALGFENETLQPAAIAVETETDISSQFLLGQRLSPNLAFFFAGNPTDVQDRTTMLQLWNLDFNPGLAVQAYQKTLDERSGLTALQRLQWGGSAGRVGLPFSRGASATADRPIVHRVRLAGDWPISKRQLKRASGLRRGLPYDPFLDFVAEVHLEQRLAAEGYPEAVVRGRTEGSERSPTIVYTVQPGQYHEIAFVGDSPPARVKREVRALYMPPPLESTAIENMRELLLRHYRAAGFPFAVVETARDGDRLVLSISRGRPLEYRGPVVDGVPERGARLIRDVLGSPAELAAAVDNPERAGRVVRSVLAGIGYTDARLEEVVTRPVEKRVSEVRLVIDPGELARIAAVEIKGRDPLGLTEELGEAVSVGAPLDRRAIDDRMAEIRRAYQQSGYDQSSVRAIPRLEGDGTWLLLVELEAGVQRQLQDVRFSGLRHIKPRYLRPGLELADGDLLNVFEVDESAIRIANFAPVERLEVATQPTGASGAEVDFEVFEKPRWTVELGLGWDNERGFEVRSGVRDDNLFGRGIGANLRLRWSDVERVALLYGSLPPLPGHRISLGGTLGYREETRELVDSFGNVIPYRELESLASVDVNFRVARGTTLKPYVRYTRTQFDYEIDFLDRTITATTVGFAGYLDRFDNPFDPHTGYSVVSDLGWSTSYLGSDVDTVQAVASGSLAVEPLRGWTWVQTARVGVAEPLMGTVLDPAVKFFAGGQGSIRGFDRDSVGPTLFGVPAGGGALFILNEELRIPVWRSLRGAVFTDVGQVWESWSEADWQLSTAVGLGLRWSTPIGLVWGDVAWPVANVGISSRRPKFYIGIGRPF